MCCCLLETLFTLKFFEINDFVIRKLIRILLFETIKNIYFSHNINKKILKCDLETKKDLLYLLTEEKMVIY